MWAGKPVAQLSNSEYPSIVDAMKRRRGVSLCRERGTTQTEVKVPKYWLSVKGWKVSIVSDNEEVGLEAAIL